MKYATLTKRDDRDPGEVVLTPREKDAARQGGDGHVQRLSNLNARKVQAGEGLLVEFAQEASGMCRADTRRVDPRDKARERNPEGRRVSSDCQTSNEGDRDASSNVLS